MQKILIVEDDTNINNLLCEALTKEGYYCEQAFSGTEARLLLNMKEYGYALVLLDLMLPGIPGETVLGEIRSNGKLPVIVLTAKDSLDDKVQVLIDGADDYITKPFEVREGYLVEAQTVGADAGRLGMNGHRKIDVLFIHQRADDGVDALGELLHMVGLFLERQLTVFDL